MRYTVMTPPPPLDGPIECLWRLDGEGTGLPAETIVPDGCMEIILHCADRFDGVDERGAGSRQPRGFVVGQMIRPLVVRPAARVETWGIRFRPGGAAAFLEGGMQDLAGRVVDLEALWGAEGRRIVERIGEAREARERRRRIEAMLLDRLRPGVDPVAGAAARCLVAARGRVRISDLASAAGIGTRQLERRFLRGVGLPPRLLGRILRFQHLFRLAHDDAATPGTWADRAVEAGYYDQAHLLRDFREFAGSTPPRFLAEQGEFSRALTSRGRLDDLFAG